MRNTQVEGMLATIQEESGRGGLIEDIDRTIASVDRLRMLVAKLEEQLKPIMAERDDEPAMNGRAMLEQETQAQRQVDHLGHLIHTVAQQIERISEGIRL